MHQPVYANRLSGEYHLPWTYLHAIKDYTDMAAHLESVPGAQAVVNFAPILLEQIDDYARQVNAYLKTGAAINDPLLAALGNAVLPVEISQRIGLVGDCLRANKTRLIDRFEDYKRLAEMASWFMSHPEANIYINNQFLVDLIMWYHLAWLGETVRREDERVRRLMHKGGGYTFSDRCCLLKIIGELLSGIIGRYKKLAQDGRIELSMTPYAHPIAPLLIDLASAREAIPDAKMPSLGMYSDGKQRLQWHIDEGIEIFQHYFGFKPVGCWPSEGGISDAAISLFEANGFRWVASGESVIQNSLSHAKQHSHLTGNPGPHRAYTLNQGEMACFFRDDKLSDLVGFTYATWHADDAVANVNHYLNNIATTLKAKAGQHVVSIILDGENAWEHYPENGYYFLSTLYKKLLENPKINLTTFSKCLDVGVPLVSMPHFVAGSWVYGTLSTWIGDSDKNRAWDMLGDAKRAFDVAVESRQLSPEQLSAVQRQLAICEGSDWFWWFGDYNPADTVSDFDHLYRMQLANVYRVIGKQPPEYLSHVFAYGSGKPALGGVMRRGSD
ncbi:MAG: glycoside hydrolase [Gammaproteobacteria bacterium]|nr:glycoside hydrolase [Gammaproteobacteria bacterium]